MVKKEKRFFDYSFLKNIINNEINKKLKQIYELNGLINDFSNIPEQTKNTLIKNSIFQSVTSSNKIENIVSTTNKIENIIFNNKKYTGENELEIQGYNDVLNIILNNFDNIDITKSNILNLHNQLYKYSNKTYLKGKFKEMNNYIFSIDQNNYKTVIFEPVDQSLVDDYITKICDEYNKRNDEKIIDPLILIPTFILDFLCIHPFSDGNGRISRLLTNCLLFQNDFMINKYISFEKIIEEKLNQYYFALRKSSTNWHNNQNDYLPFIDYFLDCLIISYNKLIDVNKKDYLVNQIIKILTTSLIPLSTKEISEQLVSISRRTLERKLKVLLEQNKIKKVGQYKNAKYKLT